MQYRKDINGLRALAVIAVILFHFNASWLPGGFAGVDVFFVISGFLMTRIIFNGIELDNFSIYKFYIARATRIIPALAFLCLVLLTFGWFFALDAEYKLLSKHVISSLAFISNFAYLKESGYFEAASQTKLLLHTWSLSVEWQFYIIYPLVLVTMRRFLTLKPIKTILLYCTIIGFVVCVFATFKLVKPAYFLLPTRAWEMLLGGVAFLYPVSVKSNYQRLLEWSGLALIIGSFLLISKDDLWPGYLALLPVLGAFLLIQSQRNDSFITTNVITQRIGTWSYSIYLWHWPLSVYLYTSMNKNLINTTIMMALSIAMGFLSYVFIEQSAKNNKIKHSFLYFVVLAFSIFIYINNGKLSARYGSGKLGNSVLTAYTGYKMDPTGLFEKCNAVVQGKLNGSPQVSSICVSSVEGGVFLWGDSHMASLSTGLRSEMNKETPFSQLTASNCPPSFTIRRNSFLPAHQACDYSNNLAYKSILKSQPRVVILGTRFHHERYDWIHTVNKLHEMGVEKVVIIGPFPQWHPSLPLVYAKRHVGDDYIQDQAFDNQLIQTNIFLKKIHDKNKNFVYIDILGKLCINSQKNELKCKAKINGSLVSFDYGHLTLKASQFIAKNYVIPIL